MSYEEEDRGATFAAVKATLEGQRFELTGVVSKVLYHMLARGVGCDARITREHFELDVGLRAWRRGTWPYRLAPPVVGQLLRWAGVSGPTSRVRAVIGPVPVDPADEFIPWSLGCHLLWLDATDSEVLFQLRDGRSTDATALAKAADPLPQATRPRALEVVFPEARACPRCGTASERYKQLSRHSESFMVCLRCGCSFAGWAAAK